MGGINGKQGSARGERQQGLRVKGERYSIVRRGQ